MGQQQYMMNTRTVFEGSQGCYPAKPLVRAHMHDHSECATAYAHRRTKWNTANHKHQQYPSRFCHITVNGDRLRLQFSRCGQEERVYQFACIISLADRVLSKYCSHRT